MIFIGRIPEQLEWFGRLLKNTPACGTQALGLVKSRLFMT